MNAPLLRRCQCWFGGGTAIVLDIGEYRLSKDIDFLCADVDGYREVRSAVAAQGVSALFGPEVRQEREVRTDQYGIRTVVSVAGVPLRFGDHPGSADRARRRHAPCRARSMSGTAGAHCREAAC